MGRPKVYDEELRELLIERAWEVLQKEGYHAVSLRVLTKSANTSTNAIYTLFGSKEALMAEVLLRELDRKFSNEAIQQESGDPFHNLLRVAEYYRQVARDSPELFNGAMAALEEAHSEPSLVGRIPQEFMVLEDHILSPLLAACKRLAEDTPGLADTEEEVTEMALSFWAAIHGFTALELLHLIQRKAGNMDRLYLETMHAVYLGWASGRVHELPAAFADRLSGDAAR